MMINHKLIQSLLIVLLISFFAYAAEEMSEPYEHVATEGTHTCFGIGLHAGIYQGGLQARLWLDDVVGFNLKGYINWPSQGTGGGALGEVMFKPRLNILVRPYIVAGIGFHAQNIDTLLYGQPIKQTLGILTARGALGAEVRFGTFECHGISLEAGYFYGSADYYVTSTTIGTGVIDTTTESYANKPLSAQLMYTYYFCRPEVQDSDGDGTIDDEDNCPTEAEDIDGFTDSDGCPDYDNDGDNIPDSLDKCANEAEDFDQFEDEDGCPDFDNDNDGISDSLDKCPEEPETINNFEDSDGCPDERPLAKEIKRTPLVLKGVTFQYNSFSLDDSSYLILDTVVASLIAWHEVIVEIEGHTDNVGQAPANMHLSLQRANAVKEYLVSKGVSTERLKTIGYGEEQPIASNNTDEGKALNRRVVIRRIN